MANPATAGDLMDLALMIRAPGSAEAIYPLTVVPADQDRSGELVANAERMLSHAAGHAAGADVPVIPLTRVDHNFANGIARGMAECRASMLIIAKVGHPPNTTERVILLMPLGADHMAGFDESVQTVKQLANRLSAEIVALTVDAPSDLYRRHLETARPDAPVTAEQLESWTAASGKLSEILRRDDLVVVLSARQGALAWDPALERLPSHLAALVPESFILIYPSEVPLSGRVLPFPG